MKDSVAQVPTRYRQLEALLAAEKWQEADQETAKLMLAVANRTEEGYLGVKVLITFPVRICGQLMGCG